MNPEIIGLLAGLFAVSATIPQIIKTHRIKEAKDISLLYFLAIEIGSFLWLTYGLMVNSASIITWNIIAILLNLTILMQKMYYDRKNK
jgi:MtN3 and saliva related transmembrane protein